MANAAEAHTSGKKQQTRLDDEGDVGGGDVVSPTSFLDEGPEESPRQSDSPLRQQSQRSLRSQSTSHRQHRQDTGEGRRRGRSAPARKSQASVQISPDVLVVTEEASVRSDVSPRTGPLARSTTTGSVKSTKSGKWQPKDTRVESVPQKEKYQAGDQHAAGDWPQSQGPRPEPGDMSELEGEYWEDFQLKHHDLAEVIYGCVDALGSRKSWEKNSEGLIKQLRQVLRVVPKDALVDTPGRRQVILFCTRIAVRRPVYRRQAAELQEMFYSP